MNRISLLGFLMVSMIAMLSASCRKSCGAGYTGSSCTAVNTRFVGIYAGGNTIIADAHSNPPVPDTITIQAGHGPDSIFINNVGSPIIGVVTANGDSFTVAPQTVMYYSVPIILTGVGMMSGDTLTGVFNGSSGGFPFTLTFVGVRE